MADKTEALPILVGLSGKRDLRGQEIALRSSLTAAFAALDAAFPHAPKVLVTGLAEGADMLASKLALDRLGWHVFGLLPLPIQDYAATMTDDAARERLQTLLGNPRVCHRTLAPLARPAAGAWPKEIAGCSDTSLHYEQLGLWLAEHTAVLLTVLPADELANRPGGTARVLQRRLCGAPDAVGRAVIDLSTELACRPILDPPHPRPVWRIDLAGAVQSGALASAIIQPDGKKSTPVANQPTDLAKLFPLAADIDGYNRRVRAVAGSDWPGTAPEAPDLLRSYRTTLSGVQGTCQIYWKRCIWALAVAFVLAVLLFEAFAKLTSDFPFASRIGLPIWAMPAYALIVLGAVGIYVLAAWCRWQSIHQDYRAVNEVLRVQRAWWQAGLTRPDDRADHYYLLGADDSLARVRQGAAAVITWVRLFANVAAESWNGVYGACRSYVEDQRAYFRRRSIARGQAVHVVGVTSWFCFALAFGMAAWFALYGVLAERTLALLAHAIDEGSGHAPPQMAWILVGCAFVVRLLSPTRQYAFLQTALPGVLIGFFALAFAMHDLGSHAAPGLATGGKAMMLITMAVLLAISGGVRFVAEKLAWEAEALAYHEAHARFSHGARLLADIDNATLPDAERLRRKQEVVRELGLQALAENEAWLRAHRERRIEPVLG